MSVKIELQAAIQKEEVSIPYFCLQLDRENTALINMSFAQEVLVLPKERLTIMPNMPGYVLGLLQHRGLVFWLIDLAQMLGLIPLDNASVEYQIVVVRVEDNWIGLAGNRSQGIRRFGLEQIVSPIGNVSPELERYLQGCIAQTEGLGLVLDIEAIANPLI
jgi:positive phototaxis protein PixI